MGRPPIHKSGAMTATERQRRWRARVRKRKLEEPKRQKLLAKQQRRAEHERKLGEYTTALGADGKLYNVIYADPPWRFEPYSRETGMDRAADNHYATMETAEIAALPAPAAKDCVLFLWATNPMLPQALDVMAAWGFAYKTNIAWAKDKIGTGYWTRNKHELLLIGTRGDVPAPAPGQQFVSLIPAPRGEHSEKPDSFRAMIETLYPTTPKFEMFARGAQIPGWERWGNEAG